MIDLITLVQAKRQLNIMLSDVSRDDDIADKISQVSELVMNHYKHMTVPEEWIVNTSPMTYDIPQWAKYATCAGVAEAFYNRESSVANVLSDAVKSLIPRDPTIA